MPVPSVVEPSVKVTVPVGMAEPLVAATVAENETFVPLKKLGADALSVVVVATVDTAAVTLTITVDEVEVLNVLSPE